MLTLLATRDYLDLGVEEKIPQSSIKLRNKLSRSTWHEVLL